MASLVRLDQSVTNALLAAESTAVVRRHLYLLPPGQLRSMLQRDRFDEKDLENVSREKAVGMLSCLHKISALIHLKGIQQTVTQISLQEACEELCFEPGQEDMVASLASYQDEVLALTDEITCYSLNALRVFRMQLFAALGRCLKHEEGHPSTVGAINAKKLNFLNILRECQKTAFDLFMALDFLLVDQSHQKAAKNFSQRLHVNLSECDMVLKQLQGIPPRVFADYAFMLKMVSLLRKAAFHPFSYLPILLKPLESFSVVCPMGMDVQTLHPRVESWLQDFVSSLRGHYEILHDILAEQIKKHRIPDSPWKLFFNQVETFIDVAAHFSGKLSTFHHNQQGRDQIVEMENQLIQLGNKYPPLLAEFNRLVEMSSKNKQFLNVVHGKWNQCVQYPFSYYSHLCEFVLLSTKNRDYLAALFQDTINDLLPTRFKTLANTTVVDLIDFNLRMREKIHEEPLKYVLHCMREYYALSEYRAWQRRSDVFDNLVHVQTLSEIQMEGSNLTTMEDSLCDLLKRAFLSRTWPKMFLRSPYADGKETERLEKPYFEAWQEICYREFLELDVERKYVFFLGELKVLEGSNVDVLPLKHLGEKAKALYDHLAKRVKGKKDDETPHLFWEEIALFRQAVNDLEKASVLLQFDRKSLPIGPLVDSLKTLDRSLELILSPGAAIKAFWDRSQLIAREEAAAKKVKLKKRHTQIPKRVKWRPPQAATVAPKVVKLPIIIEKTEEEKWQTLEKTVRFLNHLSTFTSTGEGPRQMELNALQAMSAKNLLDSLPVLKELFHHVDVYGHLPFFVHALYLKLSVAIEQAGILASAHLQTFKKGEDKEHSLLKADGNECFWQKHALVDMFRELELYLIKQRKTLLNKDQRTWLEKISHVIDVSGRHPTAGHDELADVLEEALESPYNQERSRLMKEKFQMGFGIVQSTLKVLQVENKESAEVPLTDEALKGCLSLKTDLSLQQDVNVFIQSFKEKVALLQEYLSFPANRHVQIIDEFDKSSRQRQGTIQGSLKDMAGHLELLDHLFAFIEEPSICLLLTEEMLLSQAALLENVFLIVLSHLPVRSSPRSSIHYLWEEKGGRSPRYRHSLPQFVDKLAENITLEKPFFEATSTLASQCVHYLKTSFRYYKPSTCPTTKLRDNMKALSVLRDRLARGVCSTQELRELDRHLNIADPADRQERLEDYISKVLVSEVKRPAVHALHLAYEWLAIYEELI